MAIGINDLDDDDYVSYEEQQQPIDDTQSNLVQVEAEHNNDDYMSDFLRSRGIDDMNNINFLEDDGSIITRSWNDLSNEEKISILNTPLDVEDNTSKPEQPVLTEEELSLLTQIRDSKLTPSLFIESLKGEPQEPQYQIDSLSDDELYLLDLEARVGELSDDEAAQALTIAKQNEDFYKKQIEGIRKEYKEREDFKNLQEQALLEQEQMQKYQEYSNEVIDAINSFNSIGNLDLNFENKDKEELAEFMLSQDETGANYLYQALQDPQTLTKAAWFILNGEEAFNSITDYFTNLIKTISEAQYKKGLEDGRKGGKPQVVIQKNNNKPSSIHNLTSYEDLDDDE